MSTSHVMSMASKHVVEGPIYDDVEDMFNTPDDATADEKRRQKLWVITRKQMEKLNAIDRKYLGLTPDEPGPILTRLYVAYLKMVEKLDDCWSQTYQYQKNVEMRKILDAAQVRLMEIKDFLTQEIDFSELHYVDGEIIELKLLPRDLEILKLSSIPFRRDQQLQELAERLYGGERIYIPPKEPDEEGEEGEEEELPKEKSVVKVFRPVVEGPDPKKLIQIESIWLIQKHERARTGRLEAFDEKVMHDLKIQLALNPERPKPPPKSITNPAATKIQALWRSYQVRRDMKKRYYRTRLEIKMDVPSYRPNEFEGIYEEMMEKKRRRREQKAREYIDTVIRERERVFREVGPGLMEDIGDEIRWWFRNWYDVAKAFDKYPDEEKGGTIIVVRGETMTPEEYRIEVERLRREKEKMKNNPALKQKQIEEKKKKKKEEADRKKKEKEKLKKEKKEAALRRKKGIIDPFSFKETPALLQMKQAEKEMDEEWTPLDELNMKHDNPIMDKIIDEKCCELQFEARKIVDEMMRLELELLVAALQRDRGKKAKKAKKKKKKKKKGKKQKKDISGHRTIEDIFQELFDNRVIQTYPKTNLSVFFGEYSYNNYEFRAVDMDPLPCIGDIRQVVINNIIIPLGGNTLPKPKSAVIIGPRQSGKHVLINAICSECDAVRFDISPEILFGRYSGKKDMKMLCHLVNKMARILQPSVIFVNGAEKPFYKKVPKPEKMFQPKKMKKFIFKEFVKPIGPEDRVMLLGTSNQPWNTAAGPFLKAYEKVVIMPRTDYGTVYQLWMDLLMSYHGVQRDIDVSAIAKLSVGYPIPYIREVAANVLCPRRLIRLKFEPLRPHEILEGLMTMGQPEPILDKEQDKYTKWFNKKVKLAKTRRKIVGKRRELRVQEEEAANREKNKK